MTIDSNKISRRGFVSIGATLAGAAVLATACTPSGSDAAQQSRSVAVGRGTGQGKHGELSVKTIVEDGAITDIVIDRSHETLNVGTVAQDRLKAEILATQNISIDAISGASLTCMAYLEAVKKSLEDAGLDPSDWEKGQASLKRDGELPTGADVVVIGSGGAGLAAAITAANEGKSVVVLEKLDTIGGSTTLSGAGYAAPGHWLQKRKGVEDSPELMKEDMLVGGDNEGNPDLVDVVCSHALESAEWLTYEAGVEWGPACVQDGGHSVARSILPVDYGAGLATKLIARAEALGVVIVGNAKVDSIETDGSGAVSGIKGTDVESGSSFEVAAKSVVIATGGFGRNVEMRVQYNPEMDDSYMCTDSIGATGDGIVMAQAIGADVKDMEFIQTHPTGDPQTGAMLDVGGIRVEGCAIMVNKEGKRFVEELARRDVASQAELAQTDGLGYFVFSKADAEARAYYEDCADEIASMIARGLYIEADTLEEACAHFGIDAEACAESIATWNADAEKGEDSQFGYRGEMFPIGEAPYCIFSLTPTVHYTMGGLDIDTEARVLDAEGNPISGLYAAGEVTGDVMGTNRLGTCAIPDIICFGRIAGKNAATA